MLRPPAFHSLAQPCEFYFVRHGESESNKAGRIQGHTDSPLSEVGRRHAEAAGRWFADKGIELVLTSPLTRARETAEAISKHADVPSPRALPGLIELDTGVYSDVPIRELSDTDPDLFRRFRVHSWEAVPHAERIASLQRRALDVWDELIALARGGTRRFVCVSHGGMIQWLIKATVGSGEQRWMPLFETSNCGISLFRAESTLLGHHHEADDALSDTNAMAADDEETPSGVGGAPGTGYYGVWAIMNLVPYE